MKYRQYSIITLTILMVGALNSYAEPPIPINYQISAPSAELQNEEQVVVSPIDSLYLAACWRDFRYGYRRVGYGISADGGNTWTSRMVGHISYEWQSDPTMDVDNDGNFYMSYLDFDAIASTMSAITIIKSTDMGATWIGPITVASTSTSFEDKQFVAIDRTHGPAEGNIYVAWARINNSNGILRIMFNRSIDGGLNFSTPIIIVPAQDLSYCGGSTHADAGQFAEPFVGADGAVYVSYVAFGLDPSDCSPTENLKLVKSADEGITFTEPTVIQDVHGHWELIEGGIAVYAAPSSAVDMSGGMYDGNLYLAYCTMDPDNSKYNDYNIELIRSSDGGDNWSEPIYINDDYIGPDAMYDQFHPWMAINEEGTLVVIWYDQRTDPVDHYKFDLFAAYSFDGGKSFTTNHRISEVSVDPDNLATVSGTPIRAGLIGEYIGVAAFKDHVNAVWTDTRNGNQDVFGANWVIPFMKPRLLAPADGSRSLGDPVFDWATAWKEDDDQYLLEVATDDQFANIIISETVSEPGYDPPTTLEDGTYYWRVQASTLSERETSDYSGTYQFTVDTYIPPTPVLLAPGDEEFIFVDYPEFEWEPGETPSSDVYYDLKISPDETFIDENLLREYLDIDATTFITPDPFYTDTIYYWSVQAKNWADQSSGFADAFSFELIYYTCGDLDDDTNINILDIVFLINYIYKNGPAPEPQISADVNHDGNINILDIVLLINYIYKNGVEPVCEI